MIEAVRAHTFAGLFGTGTLLLSLGTARADPAPTNPKGT